MHNDQYQITVLSRRHEKKAFSSGIIALDRYLTQQASQDARRNVSITYVLTESSSDFIIGYYTLSSGSIFLDSLPVDIQSKLPRHPTLPTTLLGRLAVDEKYQGKKLGEKLLVDALKRSHNASQNVASMAVIVDAKNQSAVNFYQRYGFINYNNIPDKLFIPMSTITKLWISE